AAAARRTIRQHTRAGRVSEKTLRKEISPTARSPTPAPETFSSTTTAQSSYGLYEAGSYGSMGYNLGSVLYRENSSGSYSLSDLSRETHTGNGVATTSSQATTTDGTHTGTNAVSDAATFSYTLTAIATLTAAGSYSAGDYLAGKYADGSY